MCRTFMILLCILQPSQVEAEPTRPVREEIATAEIQEPKTSSQLSFAFPGWEVDMSKGAKRKIMPSTSRYINGSQSCEPNKKGKLVKRPISRRASSLALNDPSTPVEGCPIDMMDDELLACVFMRLNVKDLCASMRTCKRWHRVACKEDVWEHIPLPANVPGALPSYALATVPPVIVIGLGSWKFPLRGSFRCAH